MAFFNSHNADLSEEWRKRYLNLFDAQNKIEHDYIEKEKTLRQLIIQLSLINEGSDKYLDPIVQRLRENVKNDIDTDTLRNELKIFNDSIKNMPSKRNLNVGLLFDFLFRQYNDFDKQTALRALQEKVAKQDNAFEHTSDFFLAILKIVEPEDQLVEIKINERDVINATVSVGVVCEQLLKYLAIVPVPPTFDAQFTTVRDALLAPQQSLMSFEEVLDALVQLLLKIKEFSDTEQQDIDTFLLQTVAQLSHFNVSVTQAETLLMEWVKERNTLDKSVFSQIRELQVQAIHADEVDDLKENVNVCFKSVTDKIKVNNTQEREHFLKFKDELAELVNQLIEFEVEAEQIKKELKVIHAQSLNDTLTGLANRVAFHQRLKDEFCRYTRYDMPLSMALFSIDNIKSVNTTLGHEAGDKAIALMAKLLTDNIESPDFIARFGGKEFVMLLPNTDEHVGLNTMELLRDLVAKACFNVNRKAVSLTISCGVTQVNENDTPESVFERAQTALQDAKSQGRNRCCIAAIEETDEKA
jgi:diguanylate cyclase